MKRLMALMALTVLTACDYSARKDIRSERDDRLYRAAMDDYRAGRMEAALPVQVDERDAHVFGDLLDAFPESGGLPPKEKAADGKSDQSQNRREIECERASHGVRR